MCEDYRATFGVDLDMDTADFKDERKVTCPAMILWGEKGGVGRNHDAAAVWSRYATRIERTATVPSGHYLQEECPDETYARTAEFLRDGTIAAGIANLTPMFPRNGRLSDIVPVFPTYTLPSIAKRLPCEASARPPAVAGGGKPDKPPKWRFCSG